MEKTDVPTKATSEQFENDFLRVQQIADPAYAVLRSPREEAGQHPESYTHVECAFAADLLSRAKVETILDIGSYREFVLGLLAGYDVSTVDIRPRKIVAAREHQVVCDAKALDFPDASFDAIVSLCALEHFGLGRYGDELDIDADAKSLQEMKRTLKPNGILILTTTITGTQPSLMFNAHRIYSPEMLQRLRGEMKVVEEKFYSLRFWRFCKQKELTDQAGMWDMYLAAWKK